MTPILLVDTLVEFIKPVVAEFLLDSNVQGVQKEPQVISGYLKEKKPSQKQDPPDFPYVIVRFLDSDNKQNENTASIKIIAGTYSEDTQDGWRDPLNIITRIETALLEQMFLPGPFKIEYPVKTELPEEQPYPEWIALLHLTVTIARVQEEGGYIKDVFG